MPVLNQHRDVIPTNAVYIGRGSKWGNPFIIGPHGNREDVCEKHKDSLWTKIKSGKISLEELASLDGKSLVCFCHPKRCHGDTLLLAAKWAKKELNK